MGFADFDGCLRDVTPVIVWRDELVFHLVELDPFLEFSGALVVEQVHLWLIYCAVKVVYQGLISVCHLAFCAVLYGLHQVSVAVQFDQYHDLLIAAA